MLRILKLWRGHWFIGLALVFTVTLGPTSIQATPDPGIQTVDRLLGHTPDTFFVERTTTLLPAIYYAQTKIVEILELSIWDGSIRRRCITRRTEYVAPDALSKLGWQAEEMDPETDPEMDTDPQCNAQDMLRKAQAAYIEQDFDLPQAGDYGFHLLSPTAQGVNQTFAVEEKSKTRQLMDWAFVRQRRDSMYAYSLSDHPMQQFNLWTDLKQDCWVTYEGHRSGIVVGDKNRKNWVFLSVLCGQDQPTRFFVPMGRETYWRVND